MSDGRFCGYPFLNLVINPMGHATPCCKYNLNHLDTEIVKETIKTRNFSELFYQPAMENIRNQFRRGIEPEGCKICLDEENHMPTGMREHKNNFIKIWAEHKPVVRDIVKNPKILSLDFKFSSLCNLKCRVCGPYCSSNWLKESLDTNQYHEHTIKIFSSYAERKFFKDDENFKILKEIMPDIHFMEFYGGEPLMQPEHNRVMDIVDSLSPYDKRDLVLVYNTNGTIYDQRIVDIWNKTPLVLLKFSIDDIAERFEYQRYPASWNEVVTNILKYKKNCNQIQYTSTGNIDVPTKKTGVEMRLYCTVSLYNVFYLDELIEYNRTHIKLPIDFNLVHWPECMSIANMPKNVKEQVYQKLKNIERDEYINNSLDGVLSVLEDSNSDEIKFNEFLERTKIHDEYRGQSFETVFPEFAELIINRKL